MTVRVTKCKTASLASCRRGREFEEEVATSSRRCGSHSSQSEL